MKNINDLVLSKIKEIEKNENVEILLAIESGSRAWGFDSEDSDYDIRFIYQRDVKDYLKLEGIRDVIEWQLDNTLDINGWDLQKVLRLLYRSNQTIFEWFNSNVVYYKNKKVETIQNIMPEYFSVNKGIYHYLNMAKKNNDIYILNNDHMIEIKKYFYVLRSILSANWIITNQTNPPILFTDLLEQKIDNNIKMIIEKLLKNKRNVPELKLIKRNLDIDNYINEQINYVENVIKSLPKENVRNWETLNILFRNILFEK